MPDGAHGLGQRRAAECIARRAIPHAGFCRRHGGAHHLRSFGAGLRALSGQARWISQGADAAAQRGAELYRRVSAVGGMVRLQRRQRAGAGQPGDQRFCRDAFRRGRGGVGWAAAEWIRNGKAQRAGSDLRRGGRAGGDYSGRRICRADVGSADRTRLPVSSATRWWLMLKRKFGYDDSLDAFGVHGAGGTLGALLTGVFAVSAVNPIFKDAQGNALPSGLLEGNAHQLLNQFVGVAIAWVLAIVGTLVILNGGSDDRAACFGGA